MPRRGVTLVELMIVVTVAVVLLAVAIPLAKQPLEQQKLREASRLVNAMIAGAQARAAELNRPVGILLEPSPAGVNASEGVTRIHYAEVPPLYGGDVTGAQCSIVSNNSPADYAVFDYRSYAGVLAVVRAGDLIRFNYRGRWFPIIQNPEPLMNQSVRVQIRVINPTEIKFGSAPFQIRRRPKKSVRPPVDLPGKTCIDMAASGLGNTAAGLGRWFDPVSNSMVAVPVLIMFQPTGAVDYVYRGINRFRPTGPIHLLVGRPHQVFPTAPFTVTEDDTANLRDENAMWVSVGPTTGKVTTTENLPTDGFVANPNLPFNAVAQRIMTARTFAMSSQAKGGR
jgi:prepilin-type N-terminal cleavage/methylation domain-containing protein